MVKIMSSSGIVYIIVGIVLFIPILILTQMILPFPYGMVFGLGISIAVLVVFVKKGIKKNKEPTREFTQKSICSNCNAENPSNNKFCTKCGKPLN